MIELFATLAGVGLVAFILGAVLWAFPRTAVYGKDIAVTGCAIASLSFIAFAIVKPTGSHSKAEQASVDQAPAKPKPATAPAAAPKERAPLKLSSWKCTHEYGFMTIEGEVLNRSDAPLDSLMAVGGFFTRDGEFVKSETALVEYQPLLPGQRSPFKVLATYNPAIKRCSVSFKMMFGGKIASDE